MINETLQVNEYLNGVNIHKDVLYRTCYLLSKWFREQGSTEKMDVRNQIFDWANKYHVFIDFNLNGCIDSAFSDTNRLTNNVIVKVSKSDIDEIKKRFDDKKTRKVALAVLCFAKVFADSNNEFNISGTALGDWTNIHYTNIGRKYLNELIDYGYLDKVEQGDSRAVWGNKVRTKMTKYKINVPIHNIGEYMLEDNNIEKLFHEIF